MSDYDFEEIETRWQRVLAALSLEADKGQA